MTRITACPSIIMLSLAAFGAGCVPAAKPAILFPAAAARDALTLDRLRNATYRIDHGTVTLRDGAYEGSLVEPESPARLRVNLVEKLLARGDLNADGIEEAVTLLVENSGGSGTRNFLAVVAASEGKPINVATVFLGDRIQLRSMRIEYAQLVMDTVAHNTTDAMCCPTLKVRRTFTLSGNQFSEARREERGTISAADLEGVTWILREITLGENVAQEPAITFRIDKDRIIGSAGCNGYFASYAGDGPGRLKIGTVAATRKACEAPVMNQEARYLKALEGVTSYSFLAGTLALSYRDNGSVHVLVLTPLP